ncbi:hypothetical protein, partial [Kaarinaea lacus]
MTGSSTTQTTEGSRQVNPGSSNGMHPAERRAVFSLAGIYALRMMGLFMVLPVFAIYGETLQGYTP